MRRIKASRYRHRSRVAREAIQTTRLVHEDSTLDVVDAVVVVVGFRGSVKVLPTRPTFVMYMFYCRMGTRTRKRKRGNRKRCL